VSWKRASSPEDVLREADVVRPCALRLSPAGRSRGNLVAPGVCLSEEPSVGEYVVRLQVVGEALSLLCGPQDCVLGVCLR